MSTPQWLPELVSANGDPHEVFAMLYAIFDADFRSAARQFRTMPVWWDRRVVDLPYEEGFWHLITRKDYCTGERLISGAPSVCHGAGRQSRIAGTNASRSGITKRMTAGPERTCGWSRTIMSSSWRRRQSGWEP
jgi:hypothetical protein